MDNKKPILQLEPNVAKVIVLDTEPEQAVAKDYTSKAGKPYKKYTYFTKAGEVFWVFSGVHKELLKYRKGDAVEITNIVPVGATYGEMVVKTVSGASTPSISLENNDILNRVVALENFIKTLKNENGENHEEENPNQQKLDF